jgi:D-arabinose 1-dehydrogenase-like Zn-dependent alcohol dehydrogenase
MPGSFVGRVAGNEVASTIDPRRGASMKAVTWHGKRDVRVEEVPDPKIELPTDAIVRMTTTNICGSDLHLYEILSPFMGEGDVLGHEPMGVVEEVGSEVTELSPGDRVVMPFQICCGHCFMCQQGLQTQCETTQVRDQGMGAALFGYSKLYGEVAGGQAEYLRVPQAQYTHIKVPEGPPDDRFVYLSDVLPTAWQSVAYADAPKDGTLVVLGLARSVTWPAGSPSTLASSRSSGSIWSPSGSNDCGPEGWTSSISTTTRRTWATSSATVRTVVAPMP